MMNLTIYILVALTTDLPAILESTFLFEPIYCQTLYVFLMLDSVPQPPASKALPYLWKRH